MSYLSLLLIVLITILTMSKAVVPLGNGKPNCNSEDEVGEIFRNFWDPTKYWICQKLGTIISLRCDDGLAFSSSHRACIPWKDWVWEPPIPLPNITHSFTEKE